MGCVLVADDNKLSRELMKAIIRQQGLDVVEATNGQEVLDILSQHEIDLIFMDYAMPIMSGVEVSKKIRSAESKKSSIKIIGVSAHGSMYEKECIEAGMDGYIAKPVNLNSVREHLKNLDMNEHEED